MATQKANDKIKAAMAGQAAERKATPAPKPSAARKPGTKSVEAALAGKPDRKPAAAVAAPKVRKPGNLKTTGLPNKVRALRMKASLTPAQLADKAGAGLTASFVRRIERGARQATTEQVTAIAKALGTAEAALGIKDATEAKAPRTPRAAKATGVVVPADLAVGESVEVTLP